MENTIVIHPVEEYQFLHNQIEYLRIRLDPTANAFNLPKGKAFWVAIARKNQFQIQIQIKIRIEARNRGVI